MTTLTKFSKKRSAINRRSIVKTRLEEQLLAGTKQKKFFVDAEGNFTPAIEMIPLEELDKVRITKEIATLQTRM